MEAVFELELSLLGVTADDTDGPIGVITKTDVIEALTWNRDDQNVVQAFGLDFCKERILPFTARRSPSVR